MITLNSKQLIIYQAVINYINTMPNGDFCLDDKCIYNNLNQVNLKTIDKRIIGKYFKEQVGQGLIKNVVFNYIYSNCKRCGFKDSSNKIHYKKI